MEDEILELTKRVYHALESFPGVREPRRVEITYYGGEVRRIYAWDLAEKIARAIKGASIEKSSEDS